MLIMQLCLYDSIYKNGDASTESSLGQGWPKPTNFVGFSLTWLGHVKNAVARPGLGTD